jgi:hypothetical protein
MRVAQKNNERPRVGKLVDLTRVEESTNRNGATVNATTADTNIDTEATDIDSDENQNENNNGTGVDTNRKQQDNSIGKLIETVIARRHQRAGKIKTDDPAINISGWVYSFIPYVSCSCSMLPFWMWVYVMYTDNFEAELLVYIDFLRSLSNSFNELACNNINMQGLVSERDMLCSNELYWTDVWGFSFCLCILDVSQIEKCREFCEENLTGLHGFLMALQLPVRVSSRLGTKIKDKTTAEEIEGRLKIASYQAAMFIDFMVHARSSGQVMARKYCLWSWSNAVGCYGMPCVVLCTIIQTKTCYALLLGQLLAREIAKKTVPLHTRAFLEVGALMRMHSLFELVRCNPWRNLQFAVRSESQRWGF